MRYTIRTELKSDVNIFKENKLEDRAYFVPFSDREKLESTTCLTERYLSDRVQMLSGEWDFKYYPNINSAPRTFESDELDFDKITVPSCWQRIGYEKPCYLNSRYQFKLNPPNIPSNMPVGIYRKTVLMADVGKNYVLTFLGVASAVAVYMNGDYVGYSEGSHNMSQFDVSKYARNGSNEIIAVVYKWCNGSYLECQDMFRENGIFRDVYITENDICHIKDIDIKTIKQDNGKYTLHTIISLNNPLEAQSLEIELLDKNGKEVLTKTIKLGDGKEAKSEIVLESKDLAVAEWSAEIPNIYTAYISLNTMDGDGVVVRQYVGFKDVKISKELYLVNGQAVKMKGVNHHDTDALNGWVMTPEQMERDIKLIKDYNCNTIRTSHYPPDPMLLTLCDLHGLYVIDEADIECHGIYSNPLRQKFGMISNNMLWRGHFVDRVSNMYMRDRNHPSIVMWSLGNEAGGYMCHDLAYDYLKAVSDIPVHYEGVIHTKRHSYDVVSEMYPHMDKVRKVGEHTLDDKWVGKPYFLCEYAHAMGMGPGALEEYMQLFLQYDNIIGGCIWEFCDHAVEHPEGAKWKYTYGGDHEEEKHDGNFCVDGLFFPNREPSTGALNMRNVYRPVRATLLDNTIVFTNTNRFRNSDYLTAKLLYNTCGKTVKEEKIQLDILPKNKLEHAVVWDIDRNVDNYIVIEYYDGDNKIAFEQIVLSQGVFVDARVLNTNMSVDSKNNIHTVNFGDGEIVYDGNSGEFVSYCVGGVEMINNAPLLGKKGILPNMYRGLIDNDRFIQIAWKVLGYDKNVPKHKLSSVIIAENTVNIVSKYVFRKWGKIASVVLEYIINASGEIEVKARAVKAFKLLAYSDIVRFGVTLEMPKTFDNVEYYGMGDKESLSDFDEHTHLGIFRTKVADMREPYIKPQESGNRSQTRYAKITNADGVGLMILQKDKPFNFNASHYTYNQLKPAKHMEDLVDMDTTNVQIDGFLRGAGSQSCGPQPTTDHRPNLSKPLEFSFVIKPIKA